MGFNSCFKGLMNLSRISTSLEILSQQKADCCILDHSEQPFPLPHYCGVSELWKCCFSSPQPVPALMLHSHPSLMCRADRRDNHYGCQFDLFLLLYHVSSCCHLISVLVVNFNGRNMLCPLKLKQTVNFQGGLSFKCHCNCTATYPLYNT